MASTSGQLSSVTKCLHKVLLFSHKLKSLKKSETKKNQVGKGKGRKGMRKARKGGEGTGV